MAEQQENQQEKQEQVQVQEQVPQLEQQTEPVKVSFENIKPSSLPFSQKYKCAKSSSGQVILGMINTLDQLNGTGNYVGKQKIPSNDYQKTLYPDIVSLLTELVETYNKIFVDNITDPLQLQVFGANLNGFRNDGQLNRFITCKGVNFRTTYEYAQLGCLLQLLKNRVEFIATRDTSTIKRYQNNPDELKQFEELKARAEHFSTGLNVVLQKWMESVDKARNQVKLAGTKLNAENVQVNHDHEQVQKREGFPYQGRAYQGRQYQGRQYQGRQYQGRPYQGRAYQDRPYQGRAYQNRQYQARPYQNRPYQARPYQNRPYQDRAYQDRPYQDKPYQEYVENETPK
jgi:hypothetical protein